MRNEGNSIEMKEQKNNGDENFKSRYEKSHNKQKTTKWKNEWVAMSKGKSRKN